MKALFRRAAAAAGGTLAVLLCSLAAHAAAYRSFWPEDGVHGYFGWYEPIVGVLSGGAAATVVCLFALGLRARTAAASRHERAILAWLRPWRGPSRRSGAGLAALSLGVLLVQESVERSVAVHQLALASFPASTWLVILASVALGGAVLTFLARWCIELVEIVLATRGPVLHAAEVEVAPARSPVRRRRNPLATRLGMRAPPILTPTAT
jgi:hypothetical protein